MQSDRRENRNACRATGVRTEMHAAVRWGNLKEGEYFEDKLCQDNIKTVLTGISERTRTRFT